MGVRQPTVTNSPGPLLNLHTRLHRCPLADGTKCRAAETLLHLQSVGEGSC